jgi:hypothetical protein
LAAASSGGDFEEKQGLPFSVKNEVVRTGVPWAEDPIKTDTDDSTQGYLENFP